MSNMQVTTNIRQLTADLMLQADGNEEHLCNGAKQYGCTHLTIVHDADKRTSRGSWVGGTGWPHHIELPLY